MRNARFGKQSQETQSYEPEHHSFYRDGAIRSSCGRATDTAECAGKKGQGGGGGDVAGRNESGCWWDRAAIVPAEQQPHHGVRQTGESRGGPVLPPTSWKLVATKPWSRLPACQECEATDLADYRVVGPSGELDSQQAGSVSPRSCGVGFQPATRAIPAVPCRAPATQSVAPVLRHQTPISKKRRRHLVKDLQQVSAPRRRGGGPPHRLSPQWPRGSRPGTKGGRGHRLVRKRRARHSVGTWLSTDVPTVRWPGSAV